MIDLISLYGNVKIMYKEIKDTSKRSFLNEKLWDKLKYLDGFRRNRRIAHSRSCKNF